MIVNNFLLYFVVSIRFPIDWHIRNRINLMPRYMNQPWSANTSLNSTKISFNVAFSITDQIPSSHQKQIKSLPLIHFYVLTSNHHLELAEWDFHLNAIPYHISIFLWKYSFKWHTESNLQFVKSAKLGTLILMNFWLKISVISV